MNCRQHTRESKGEIFINKFTPTIPSRFWRGLFQHRKAQLGTERDLCHCDIHSQWGIILHRLDSVSVIHQHPWVDRDKAWLQTAQCCSSHLMQRTHTADYHQWRDHQSINQTIKFIQCQYPQHSWAQWHYNQISVQQQLLWSSSITTGLRMCWCLWGKGQVNEMCLETFP